MTYLDRQFDKYLVKQSYKFDFGNGYVATVEKVKPYDLFVVKTNTPIAGGTNLTNLGVKVALETLEKLARAKDNGK